MAPAKRAQRRSARAMRPAGVRSIVDASVFLNAFNPHEEGHAESLKMLAAIKDGGDPVIAHAARRGNRGGHGRATDDPVGATRYARATAALPQ
jgi:hypothetical protein